MTRAIPPDVEHPEDVREIKDWCGPRLHKCSDARVEALWRQFSETTTQGPPFTMWLPPAVFLESFKAWLDRRWGKGKEVET